MLDFSSLVTAGIGESKSTQLEGNSNSAPCDNHCSGSHHNISGKWTYQFCANSSESRSGNVCSAFLIFSLIASRYPLASIEKEKLQHHENTFEFIQIFAF
jgi:hypothetical protein